MIPTAVDDANQNVQNDQVLPVEEAKQTLEEALTSLKSLVAMTPTLVSKLDRFNAFVVDEVQDQTRLDQHKKRLAQNVKDDASATPLNVSDQLMAAIDADFQRESRSLCRFFQ
jgi:hypothetical protein